MRGILTSGLLGLMLTSGAMAKVTQAISGTAANDERDLEELKKNRNEIEKQEENAKVIEKKQIDKYRVPGASERGSAPIFRQGQPVDSDD